MTRNKNPLKAALLATLIVTGAFGMVAAPVSAQDSDDGDSGVVDDLFAQDGDKWTISNALGFASGLMERYNPLAEKPDEASASEYRDATMEQLNQNNGVLMNWTNPRANASTDFDVVRVKFTDSDGNSEWLFITADVNTTTDNYTSVQAMNLTEFKSTDREIDRTYRLSPYASRMASQELETFISEYAEPDKDLLGTDDGMEYLSKMAGKYDGELSGDELPAMVLPLLFAPLARRTPDAHRGDD